MTEQTPPPPALVFMPPEIDERPMYALQVPPSPVRVAIVGDDLDDDPLDTNEQIYAHALREAWPSMLESVTRRGLVPDGQWTMVVVPRDYDYHEILVEDVAAAIDEQLRENPLMRVKYIVEVVDSAHLSGPFPLSSLN